VITNVRILNGVDFSDRLDPFNVAVDDTVCASNISAGTGSGWLTVGCGTRGSVLRVLLPGSQRTLALCGVQVFVAIEALPTPPSPPPKPPPALLPPLPHLPIADPSSPPPWDTSGRQIHVLTVVFTIQSTLEAFGLDAQRSLRARLANFSGVRAEEVALDVGAASVLVSASITMTSSSSAQSLAASIRETPLASLSRVLDAPLEAITTPVVERVTVEPRLSPPPLPGQPPSPPRSSTSANLTSERTDLNTTTSPSSLLRSERHARAQLAVGLVGGLLVVCALGVLARAMSRRRRERIDKTAGGASGSTGSSCASSSAHEQQPRHRSRIALRPFQRKRVERSKSQFELDDATWTALPPSQTSDDIEGKRSSKQEQQPRHRSRIALRPAQPKRVEHSTSRFELDDVAWTTLTPSQRVDENISDDRLSRTVSIIPERPRALSGFI
jgi:hypothetical protein